MGSAVSIASTQGVGLKVAPKLPSIRRFMQGLAVAGGLGLGGLAMLFLARRTSGGITQPLPPVLAIVWSASLAAGAALVRAAGVLAWLLRSDRIDRRLVWTLFVFPGLACFIAALAVAVPASSPAASAGLFVPLALAEVFSLASGAWIIRHGDGVAQRLCWLGSKTPRRRYSLRAPAADETKGEAWLPRGATQRLVRRLVGGRDCCEGAVRVDFAPGQRTEVVHIAFCPPFESTPRWTADVVDGPALAIKQVQVFSHGARVEARLGQLASQPVHSVLRFQAVESDQKKEPRSC